MSIARLALAAAAVGVILLSGCASTEPTVSLTDSKGMVQLVRNEAGLRLPTDDVATVELVDDSSEACLPAADDPKGIERRWASTLLVTFTAESADTLEATYQGLIDSFVGNGWSEVSYGGGGAVTLQKPGSDASIAFAVTKPDEDAATAASIRITIHSACVTTGGAESDEVTELEAIAG